MNPQLGRPFHKMTGSGNDFVVFDSSSGPFDGFETVEFISGVCARGTSVGADGVVFLESAGTDTARMRYYNADGSRANLCGNASLCAARLAVELGLVVSSELTLETDAGRLAARIREGIPEIDLEPVEEVRPDAGEIARKPGEARLGFALVGVPHVVVELADVEAADLAGRGGDLRRHPSLRDGANVNFVSRGEGDAWTFRTYERGVERETLACGTGAVATALMLSAWGKAGKETSLLTRSGNVLTVTLKQASGKWYPSLRGEGRIVFQGFLREAT